VINAYRLVRSEHAEDAYSGEGAKREGGRWNSPGRRMVYTAGSQSLATLELIANVLRPRLTPELVLVECLFPEGLVEEIDHSLLPDDWYRLPAPSILKAIGDAWLISLSSAVLAVPGAIIPTETNYLLNPEHPDFRSIEIGLPKPFRLDLRLLS
jgi:RES domain-containing protein